jgi:ribosomal protein S18 acetylase RimI-like enzyme
MIDLEPPFRRATPEDAAAMAELVNFAGENLPVYLWSKMAGPGQSAWEFGRLRAQREEGAFSYRNTVIAEAEDGRVAGCLLGYPLPKQPEPIPSDLPAMFVPLQELENLAPGTWYVNVVALYPEFRGHGWGSRLLALADRIAADLGLSGLSIIVSDGNAGARRLYERCGYREAATRPMVKEEWESSGSNWVLMVKGPSASRKLSG